MTDSEITDLIKEAAVAYGLYLTFRNHGGKFRTVYLSACSALPRAEQASRLNSAYNFLRSRCGFLPLELHNDPLIEIDSIWLEE